jgi:tetratricopeptide (TPR) repeat protein
MQIKKKLTRKQFLAQDDEVMSFMKKSTIWVKKNASLIVFGVIGVGVVVAAVWGYRYKKESNFTNASRLLSEARMEYNAKVKGEASAPDDLQSAKSYKSKKDKYTAAISTLDQVLQLYPSQPGAEDALFLKAESYYNMGEYDKAILTYKQYIEKYNTKGAYNAQALASIGYSYEAKENYQEAARSFQKVVDDYQDYLLRDSVFMELGRCYEQLKDWEKAKDAYQKVVVNFSDSPLLKDAQSKLDAMKPNPAAADSTGAAADSTGRDSGAEKAPEAPRVSETNKSPESNSQPPTAFTGQTPETRQAPSAATGKTPETSPPVQGQGNASEKN